MHDWRATWRELAAIYDQTRAFPADGERIVPRAVVDRLRALGARLVLDLGCGTGRFALPLARAGLRVVGVDRSPEMLSFLTAKRADARLDVVRCDAESLPFRQAFDAVVFSHFLHFVPSIETFAAELRRVLAPGACVVVVDSGSAPRPAAMRVLGHVMPLLEGARQPWPTGKESRDRGLLRELLGHLGGRELGAFPCATLPNVRTLRQHLDDVRDRTWSRFREHPADAAARAADAAERALLAEGADLDAPVEEAVAIRLLVGRLPGG